MTPQQTLAVPSWPFAKPDEQTPAYAAELAITVQNGLTIITPGVLTGNANLDLTINPDLTDGSMLILQVAAQSNGNNLALGTGFTAGAAAIVGVASKTKTQTFMLIGGAFTPIAAPFQIN